MLLGKGGDIIQTNADSARRINGVAVGCAIICVVFLLTWLFSYVSEPIGDDLLCYYDGALTFYLDDFSCDLGKRISSFDQVFKLIGFVYKYWSGRITGYF